MNNTDPAQLGADIVVHSVTKYISGHSDVVMGAVVTNSVHIYEKLRRIQNGIGAVPSPFDCYMALRGLQTLHVRLEKSAHNATHVAAYLEKHPMVQDVIYPGLASHPQHYLANKQMKRGFGGMVSFRIKCFGGRACSTNADDSEISYDVIDDVKVWLGALRIWILAESLGAVESLAESPPLMTHASVPVEERKRMGLTDSLVRLSVGIENIEDLVRDLDCAFEAVKRQYPIDI